VGYRRGESDAFQTSQQEGRKFSAWYVHYTKLSASESGPLRHGVEFDCRPGSLTGARAVGVVGSRPELHLKVLAAADQPEAKSAVEMEGGIARSNVQAHRDTLPGRMIEQLSDQHGANALATMAGHQGDIDKVIDITAICDKEPADCIW
jgi:hypothetical protein